MSLMLIMFLISTFIALSFGCRSGARVLVFFMKFESQVFQIRPSRWQHLLPEVVWEPQSLRVFYEPHLLGSHSTRYVFFVCHPAISSRSSISICSSHISISPVASHTSQC